LHDRSSRPHRSPARLSARREAAILARREATLEGPHRIAWALGEAPSTVHRVLRRLGAPRLQDLDRPTRVIVRYERERPGELVHVDIKKQGRIPTGGGWRVRGKGRGSRTKRGSGYDFVHAAVDDRSRLAYAEILADERKESASAFMTRAIGFFADRGVKVERVLTDNGSCYRSGEFARVLTEAGVGHRWTRPYRPQTNGKIERFHRSLKAELLNARTYLDLPHAQRAFEGWRALYNHERPHDALGLNTPASRYRVSPRTYPSSLPGVQYLPGDVVRTVSWNGEVRLNGHRLRVSNALLKLPIAFRADPAHDGCFDVYFCHHRFMHVDLRALSEQP
jgi:transposase InsO family protein